MEVYNLDIGLVKKIGLDNLKKWSEALKKNKRKARGCLKDKNGGKCCLRVAEETLYPGERWGLPDEDYPRKVYWPNKKFRFIDFIDTDKGFGGHRITFAHINDGLYDSQLVVGDKKYKVPFGKGLSHKKIAEIIDYVIEGIEE